MVALSAIGAAKLSVASPRMNESYELKTRRTTGLITSKLFLLPLFTPFYVYSITLYVCTYIHICIYSPLQKSFWHPLEGF